uniref:Pepsin-I3 domain-containing protein n=1 Tax=Parastrongyloides trichosuri TaxID=131310 RepID=A0A0N4Z914_PARTI
MVKLFLILSLFTTVYSQIFIPPTAPGSTGCVVTAKKLFSNGNYIREITEAEVKEMTKYQKDLADYKKKIDSAFENADNIESEGAKPPPVPVKPNLPSFCLGKDTVTYVLAGCKVQNNKVYINSIYVRDLDTEEKKKLNQFIDAMTDNTKTENKPQINLDFCHEF